MTRNSVFRVFRTKSYNTNEPPKNIALLEGTMHYCIQCFRDKWVVNPNVNGTFTEDPDMFSLFNYTPIGF